MTVSAVSYLNTVPMVYGITHAVGVRIAGADLHSVPPSLARTCSPCLNEVEPLLAGTELLLTPPRLCAEAFASGAAQVALLPTGALLSSTASSPSAALFGQGEAQGEARGDVQSGPQSGGARIVTDYCIGASGDVRTVVIVSDSPIGQVRRLYLDNHSLTSVALSGVLCRELWNIAPERIPMGDMAALPEALAAARPGDAFLLIGDKVFDHEGRFTYSYDLARAWRELTGLPFVFAVWVAAPQVGEEYLAALNAALGYGVQHIPQAVAASAHAAKDYAVDYLTRNIDFRLDQAKRRSLALFLSGNAYGEMT